VDALSGENVHGEFVDLEVTRLILLPSSCSLLILLNSVFNHPSTDRERAEKYGREGARPSSGRNDQSKSRSRRKMARADET